MPSSSRNKSERKHARKKRNLEERRNSYNQITSWNPDLDELDTLESKPLVHTRCSVKKHHIIMVTVLLTLCCLSIGLSLSYGFTDVPREFPPTKNVFTEQRPAPSTSPLKTFQHAAIVADADECAEIGADILRQGGSAVDAAIAGLLCVGVVNCQSAGIGGGLMMTVHHRPTNTTRVLIGREVAPAAATRDMYVGRSNMSKYGWKAIGVPGELAAYWQAHQLYGKLPWRTLFVPTIRLCREGYRINKHQAAKLKSELHLYKNDPTMKSLFIDPTTNEPYGEGHLVRRPVLAETLQKVADNGVSEFYNGSVARQLVKDIQDNGGIITLEDMQKYKARWVEPVSVKLSDGTTVLGVPPPGSGSLLAFVFNILDGYNYTRDSFDSQEAYNLLYHRMVEAFKFAYAKRGELGDPVFVDVAELMSDLESPQYADAIRRMIDDERTSNDPRRYNVSAHAKSDHGTAHLSVIDAEGSAVSVTSTVNLVFGAHVISPSTGVLLNDEMDDFSTPGTDNFFGLPASPSNYIQPGKMMMSSMCPTIFLDKDGQVRLVTGAAGGSRITSGTVYSAFRHLVMGENLKEANDFPRIHHQLIPMNLQFNAGFPESSVQYLRGRGHNVSQWDKMTVVPMLARVGGRLHGNMDYRKEAGDVRGY